jgi:hypothetical protein
MQNETRAAKAIRGLVKTVFIGCYIAFMWASIHHIAAFYNNYEENSGNLIGSYMLAGAIDITALVTTIGVMFFRKSMPAWVFWIVWTFIIAIAVYSFCINWEYASHYQNMDLIMQPTGETTPVYDANGMLHYVPVMQVNTSLLWVNPILASGFTIFSLIYSVIAEFFGTKAETLEELQAKQAYLEETASVLESIKQLEGKRKGKSMIAILKDTALEGKEAWKELKKKDEAPEESKQQSERNTDEQSRASTEESAEETIAQTADKEEESAEKQEKHFAQSREANIVASHYEKAAPWLFASSSTVPLRTVSGTMSLSMKMLRNRVETKQIRATKNKEIVYKSSVIEWAITEIIPKESTKIVHLNTARKAEEMIHDSESQTTKHETAKV